MLLSVAGAAAVSGAGAAVAEGIATIASLYASFERRRQEWELARQLAHQDVAIGNQQIRVAQDRGRITGQERVIAQLDADNAEQTVEFLAGKFTNVDLYDWMAGVLEGVYRYFLQQATAMAQLAASQLGFPAFATKNTTRIGGSDPASDAAGVARQLRDGVTRFLQLERELLPARSRDLFVKHPYLGDLTLPEWLRFHALHSLHHAKQIRARLAP